ncbi:MAG TPA: hypothetical protein V6D12_00105, partial [Candidatus Obscuribacterales bacterium]
MLSALIWVPVLAAVILVLLPQTIKPKVIKQITLAITVGVFIWSIVLASHFQPGLASLQFSEFIPWIENL